MTVLSSRVDAGASGLRPERTILNIMFLLPFIGFAVLAVVLIQNSRRRSREREMMWQHWTHARNWLFHSQWPQIVRRFRGGPFGQGSSRKAYWGFEGAFNNIPMIGFQYQYTTSNGDSSTTHRHLIVAARINNARFPNLRLGRRRWGRRGVTFENAHFNDLWRVDGSSDRFAHDFFNPRTIEVFLQPHPPFQRLWLEGDHILLQLDHNLPPEEIDARLLLLTRIISFQPDFLFREVGAQPPQLTQDGPGVSMEEQRRRIWGMQQRALNHSRS